MLRVVLLSLACLADAFSLAGPALRVHTPRPATQSTVTMMAKKKVPTLEERGYWAGEWVCADCGYIYEPDPVSPFEELPNYWKCPQCAGPRRRFVKKAGGMVAQLDDSPLVIGTAASALLVVALVYFGLTS